MNFKKRERKRLLKIHGHRYKRVGGLDWEKCSYCCSPMNVYDHVPPIAIIEGIDIDSYLNNGGSFRLYPSCSQCNGMLGAYPSVSFYERLEYLAVKYEKKLDKVEIWSNQEISELGEGLRNYVLESQQNISVLNDKYINIVERMYSDEYEYLEHFDSDSEY